MSELLSLGDVTKQHLTALYFHPHLSFQTVSSSTSASLPLTPTHPHRAPATVSPLCAVRLSGSLHFASVSPSLRLRSRGNMRETNVATEEGGIIQVTLVWRERGRIASSLPLRLPPPSLDFSLSLSLSEHVCWCVCLPPLPAPLLFFHR